MQSYKELIVWQKSMQLVSLVYRLTKKFPKSEMYGLISQMRRAAVSIPANIAEGYARKHRGEYIQFVRISYGSAAELETYFVLVKDLEYASSLEIQDLETALGEVLRMLNSLCSSLEGKHS